MTKLELVPVTQEQIQKAITRLEWITSFLIIAHRFVHVFLRIMHKTVTTKVETMSISVHPNGHLELKVNPTFFESLTDEQAVFVLYHEVLHAALGHCTRRVLAKNILAGYAADLAVNDLIPVVAGICERPPMGVYVSAFKLDEKFVDIEEKQTMEWYYNYLRNKLVDPSKKSYSKIDDHDEWNDNEMAENLIYSKIKEIERSGLWGSIGSIEKEIILAAQIKKINWMRLIKNWFGSQITRSKKTTRKKPHRRFGYLAPGYTRSYRDKWLVAIDTSGSVWGADILGDFISILNQLIDEDIPLDFMQFDAAITEKPHLYDKRMDKIEMKGCGGTNFQPVIDIVDKENYKGVLILTDGEAAAPTQPKRAQVLWVLPSGCNPPVTWGTPITLTKLIR